ncbi:hypothetical protein T484DRAFT_1779407 [Baffinella frigidus]|nr:hypothetical protein T484DRAFT_1779407 [Cryptophyta sp. CCMP2293]
MARACTFSAAFGAADSRVRQVVLAVKTWARRRSTPSPLFPPLRLGPAAGLSPPVRLRPT